MSNILVLIESHSAFIEAIAAVASVALGCLVVLYTRSTAQLYRLERYKHEARRQELHAKVARNLVRLAHRHAWLDQFTSPQSDDALFGNLVVRHRQVTAEVYQALVEACDQSASIDPRLLSALQPGLLELDLALDLLDWIPTDERLAGSRGLLRNSAERLKVAGRVLYAGFITVNPDPVVFGGLEEIAHLFKSDDETETFQTAKVRFRRSWWPFSGKRRKASSTSPVS